MSSVALSFLLGSEANACLHVIRHVAVTDTFVCAGAWFGRRERRRKFELVNQHKVR